MSNEVNITNSQQMLEKLARKGLQGAEEVSVVTSPGARTVAWAVKIKSLFSYNVYNVCAVVIGEQGTLPVEIGQEMRAVNLAESFIQQGQLPAGVFAVMFRMGERNVFYAKPQE